MPPRDGRDGLTLTAPPALFVPRKLQTQGLAGYEPEALACFLAALEHAPGGAVLDIGANVGVYTALASVTTDRPVYGFEPAPELTAVMRTIARDNSLGFTVEECALSDHAGSATFYLSDKSDTSNSLASGFRTSSRQVEVALQTLDLWSAQNSVNPAVLKIDTETTEPEVIRGGLSTITAHQPWIFCEVLYGREQPLTEVLQPLGFSWFYLAGEPPYEPRGEIVGDGTYEHLMWLFTPEPPGLAYWRSVRAWSAALAECTPAEPAT